MQDAKAFEVHFQITPNREGYRSSLQVISEPQSANRGYHHFWSTVMVIDVQI